MSWFARRTRSTSAKREGLVVIAMNAIAVCGKLTHTRAAKA